ncbi:ketopantoate reductase family protein [Pollutimonas harenae]|uniref:2-dehydropantoate 2-reductase n=1 Tax=Pollutimonas harenae TaxID=657015 RepID=A0A853GX99_9BURK|nr:2-dehydropantoate 2-reductase [Pollutimonas harenae]NYT85376.1 2-dehydropantoate 2-reductase [Pollutimonas harenae]TEA70476.1 2-dehydropantoate 2-reductase [Pollutimonas harenae]
MAKVAIVGCGAMGSVYAGLMAHAGHEVYGVTLWPDHAAAIQQKGLRVSGISGDKTMRLAAASTTTDGIGVCDLVIIATKAFDVQAAASAALSLIGPCTVIQTIQNGVGSPDTAAQVLPANQMAVGVVGGYGASVPEPGHAHHNGFEVTWFAKYAGLSDEQMEDSADVWRSSGFQVALHDDVRSMVWKKLIMNVAFSGTSCATGLTIGQILANENAWKVARACSEEAVAVCQAQGIDLGLADPIAHVQNLGGKIPNARPSMLLDSLAGRHGEIDAINGAISRLGAELGVPTPVNDVVVAIVKAKESLISKR